LAEPQAEPHYAADPWGGELAPAGPSRKVGTTGAYSAGVSLGELPARAW